MEAHGGAGGWDDRRLAVRECCPARESNDGNAALETSRPRRRVPRMEEAICSFAEADMCGSGAVAYRPALVPRGAVYDCCHERPEDNGLGGR